MDMYCSRRGFSEKSFSDEQTQTEKTVIWEEG